MRTCAGADFHEKMADAQLVGVSLCGLLPQKIFFGRTFFAGGESKFCAFFFSPVGEKEEGKCLEKVYLLAFGLDEVRKVPKTQKQQTHHRDRFRAAFFARIARGGLRGQTVEK